jgi:hypothetical protein
LSFNQYVSTKIQRFLKHFYDTIIEEEEHSFPAEQNISGIFSENNINRYPMIIFFEKNKKNHLANCISLYV